MVVVVDVVVAGVAAVLVDIVVAVDVAVFPSSPQPGSLVMLAIHPTCSYHIRPVHLLRVPRPGSIPVESPKGSHGSPPGPAGRAQIRQGFSRHWRKSSQALRARL